MLSAGHADTKSTITEAKKQSKKEEKILETQGRPLSPVPSGDAERSHKVRVKMGLPGGLSGRSRAV